MLGGARAALLLLAAGACTGVDARPPAAPPSAPLTTAATTRPASTPAVGFLRGRADAPVLVVAFSDYGCAYCADFERTVLPLVEHELVDAGRVRWRQVPIATASTPHARLAAAAAQCAAEQGAFWPLHERLFAHRAEWRRIGDPTLRFAGYARALGLDEARFTACLRDPHTAADVEALLRLGRQLDVRFAPTFFVNGVRVVGVRSPDEFRAVLRDALARAARP